VPLADADLFLTTNLLSDFGHIDRPERVWESGSDNSADLAETNELLIDLTSQLGTGAFRAGTPQRLALNQRITDLATRQAELSALTVKPAGWAWKPTGELFSDWWERQDTTSRNTWLRSMGIRVTFDNPNGFPEYHSHFGYMERIEEQLQIGQRSVSGHSSS
jgi:site-specific DNA recombinase